MSFKNSENALYSTIVKKGDQSRLGAFTHPFYFGRILFFENKMVVSDELGVAEREFQYSEISSCEMKEEIPTTKGKRSSFQRIL